MKAEGSMLHTESTPQVVEKNADGSLTLHLTNGESYIVHFLIWAIGSKPATDNLNIEAAAVIKDEPGFIKVDKYQNINVPGVYAVGDNTGAVELTPVAVAAGVASQNGCLTTSRKSIWITLIFRPWCSAIHRLALSG